MKKNIFLLNILCFCFLQSIIAQSIRRSTLCSVATKHTNIEGHKVASTFGGKSLICGTFFDGTTYIRQGFQQPNDSNQTTMAPCFGSSFEIELLETDCGTYFNFEYVGGASAPEANFNWDFGLDAFPATSNQQNPEEIGYISIGPKIIVLEVSQDTCFETVNFLLDVEMTAFGVNPNITPISCDGEELAAINLETGGGTSPFTYQWEDGTTNPNRTGLEAGEYAYTVTDAEGCAVTNSVLIEVINPLSLASNITNILDSTLATGAIEIDVAGGAEPYTYNWSNGSTEPNLINIKIGSYTLTITDANDCESKFAFEVVLSLPAGDGFVINDVFTPNGDNINDTWVIEGIERFPDNELQIFNRWGDVVYQTISYNNTWIGDNNNGDLLPAGPYWFVLRLNDAEEMILSRSVTIIR